MVRQRMRRAPGLAGGAIGVGPHVRRLAARKSAAKPERVRFEVDDRCKHLTTPSIWYSEEAGNWFIAVLITALWIAAGVQGLVV